MLVWLKDAGEYNFHRFSMSLRNQVVGAFLRIRREEMNQEGLMKYSRAPALLPSLTKAEPSPCRRSHKKSSLKLANLASLTMSHLFLLARVFGWWLKDCATEIMTSVVEGIQEKCLGDSWCIFNSLCFTEFQSFSILHSSISIRNTDVSWKCSFACRRARPARYLPSSMILYLLKRYKKKSSDKPHNPRQRQCSSSEC